MRVGYAIFSTLLSASVSSAAWAQSVPSRSASPPPIPRPTFPTTPPTPQQQLQSQMPSVQRGQIVNPLPAPTQQPMQAPSMQVGPTKVNPIPPSVEVKGTTISPGVQTPQTKVPNIPDAAGRMPSVPAGSTAPGITIQRQIP